MLLDKKFKNNNLMTNFAGTQKRKNFRPKGAKI